MKSVKALTRKAFTSTACAYYRAGAKLTIALWVMSPPAHADAIERLLGKVVNLLTNRYARYAGIIAIACLGYQLKWGELDKRKALYTMIGIATVLGAATLYDQATS